MKAISIKQPWANFICAGKKLIEIRTWKSKHRGPILIHAGKQVDKEASLYYDIEPSELYKGGIIGVATLVDVIDTEDLAEVWDTVRDVSMEYDEYVSGKVGWVFSNAEFFEKPLPYKGQLGVFNYAEN